MTTWFVLAIAASFLAQWVVTNWQLTRIANRQENQNDRQEQD